MQRGAVLLCVCNSAGKRFVFKKVAVRNTLCNTGQFLVDNTTGADIGMPYLTVAHLTVGKPDVHAGSTDISSRIFRKQLCQIRSGGSLDSVAVFTVISSKTVKNT